MLLYIAMFSPIVSGCERHKGSNNSKQQVNGLYALYHKGLLLFLCFLHWVTIVHLTINKFLCCKKCWLWQLLVIA